MPTARRCWIDPFLFLGAAPWSAEAQKLASLGPSPMKVPKTFQLWEQIQMAGLRIRLQLTFATRGSLGSP
jgi:hypothetical protein